MSGSRFLIAFFVLFTTLTFFFSFLCDRNEGKRGKKKEKKREGGRRRRVGLTAAPIEEEDVGNRYRTVILV